MPENFCCLNQLLANSYWFLTMSLAPNQTQWIHKTTLRIRTIIIYINEDVRMIHSKAWCYTAQQFHSNAKYNLEIQVM